MAATVFGGGSYGCGDESLKGLHVAEQSLDVQMEKAYAPDFAGEDVGKALYNERATYTSNGVTITENTTGQTIAGALDVATTALFGTDTNVTWFHVEQIGLTNTNTDFQTGNFTAEGSVNITDPGP